MTWLSLRNAPEAHIVAVDQLNTYDVLYSDDVVFTKGAFDAFVGSAANDIKAAKVSTSSTTESKVSTSSTTEDSSNDEVAEVAAFAEVADVVEAPSLPAGAKAPTKTGKAPKGYDVKGNADSGLYHLPDGQWYDATEAEFWFKSAEDAEAAGFTKAGARKKKAAQETGENK